MDKPVPDDLAAVLRQRRAHRRTTRSKGADDRQTGSDGVMNFITATPATARSATSSTPTRSTTDYPVVKVLNKAGYYIVPTQYNVAVALTKAKINTGQELAELYLRRTSTASTSTRDPRTYPMSSYSYMIIPTGADDPRMTTAKRQTLADFLYYSMCAGPDARSGPIGYSPLPINLVQAGFEQIAKLKTADPTVDLTERATCRTCNNPTFVAGQPERRTTSPRSRPSRRPATRRQGPCGDGTDPGRQHRQPGNGTGSNGTGSGPGGGSGAGSGGTAPDRAAGPDDASSGEPGTTTGRPADRSARRRGRHDDGGGGDASPYRSTWPSTAGRDDRGAGPGRCAPAAPRPRSAPPWLVRADVATLGRDLMSRNVRARPSRSRMAAALFAAGAAIAFPSTSADAASSEAAPAFTASKTVTRSHARTARSTSVDRRTVKVTVSQTKDLRDRQEIDVRWSGARPTAGIVADQNSGDARQEEYPVVLLQCRGVDSPSVAAAKAVSPRTCWSQTYAERYQDDYNTSLPSWRLDRYASAAQQEAHVGEPATLPEGCFAGAQSTYWLPFVAEDGTTYRGGPNGCAGMAPEAANVGGSALPGNTTYGITELRRARLCRLRRLDRSRTTPRWAARAPCRARSSSCRSWA